MRRHLLTQFYPFFISFIRPSALFKMAVIAKLYYSSTTVSPFFVSFLFRNINSNRFMLFIVKVFV